MDRIVLDTNIIVSGLISAGKSRKVLNLVLSGQVEFFLSFEVLSEYIGVLRRPKFTVYRRFSPRAANTITSLQTLANMISPARHVSVCSDSDDNKFVELALEASADYLITNNIRHFPAARYQNIRIVTPSEYLELTSQ